MNNSPCNQRIAFPNVNVTFVSENVKSATLFLSNKRRFANHDKFIAND